MTAHIQHNTDGYTVYVYFKYIGNSSFRNSANKELENNDTGNVHV
jgi:hypothetical protein